ncbi:hemerythrin family protein [Myxococcota bacterium]|nr:hemerythrin family protein [Myxococcota bacterium]
MALIEWNDSFSVNVKELDDEHKQLLKILNNLNEAMLERRGKEVSIKIIQDLLDYAHNHFATEERYFFIYRYPETEAHTAEHQQFSKKIEAFKKSCDEGHPMLSVEMLKFLREWWTGHVLGSDKDYQQLFNDRGLF